MTAVPPPGLPRERDSVSWRHGRPGRRRVPASPADRGVRPCRAAGHHHEALGLIVVITALPARLFAVPPSELSPHRCIVLNLLAGSLLGDWIGAHWATKLKFKTLFRIIAVLLVLIADVRSRSPDGARRRSRDPHRARGRTDGSRWRRAADPHDCAALRHRHQNRRQPLPGRVTAHHTRRVRPLQP